MKEENNQITLPTLIIPFTRCLNEEIKIKAQSNIMELLYECFQQERHVFDETLYAFIICARHEMTEAEEDVVIDKLETLIVEKKFPIELFVWYHSPDYQTVRVVDFG